MCCTESLLEVVLKKSKWHICETGSLQTGAAVPFGRGTDAGEKKQKTSHYEPFKKGIEPLGEL